jgi:5-methylcytosine-specific restriction endonuclease McrA
VFERAGGRCDYCGRAAALQLEHCTPIARGGWNSADNAVAACAPCNVKKGTQTVLEFMGVL